MNYQRIYDELIADRRLNPPSSDEYVELHHIVPRCMGGLDVAENIIRLRPEDHFFAHLLLAKVHDTASMWGAVMIMHTRRSRSEVILRKTRLAYGFARRRYGQLCSEFRVGEANPNFNPDLVTLKHLDGSVVSLNRMDWVSEYDMTHAALRGVMTGKSKSYKGWMLPNTNPDKTGILRGKHSGNADNTIRYWRHVDGRAVIADKYTLAERHGLRLNDLSGVVKGKHGHHRGWHIDPTKIGWSNKPNRVLGVDDTIYTFSNTRGDKARGNRKGLALACGINERDVSALLMGTRKSANRWMTSETYESGYSPTLRRIADNDNVQLSLFAA